MTREEFMQDAMLRIMGNVKPMDATNENLCNDIIRFVDKITKSVYGPTEEEKAEMKRIAEEEAENKRMWKEMDEKRREERSARAEARKDMPKVCVVFYSSYTMRTHFEGLKKYNYCSIKTITKDLRCILMEAKRSGHTSHAIEVNNSIVEYCLITEEQANKMLEKCKAKRYQSKDLDYITNDTQWHALCIEYGLEHKNLKEYK